MPIKYKRNCDYCNKEYFGQGIKFCSIKCAKKSFIPSNKGKKSGENIKCKYCGKEFYLRPSYLERNIRHCSYKCRNKNLIIWNKGLTKETNRQVRRNAQALKGRKSTSYWLGKKRLHMSGNRHWFWKGGITPLEHSIRQSLEYKSWRLNIYKRDNYICQECRNKSKGNIEAHHHNKSFMNIFKDFLKQYSQFSPIEDKETLMRLATNYEPFWDINNGITLCKSCHKRLELSLRQEV